MRINWGRAAPGQEFVAADFVRVPNRRGELVCGRALLPTGQKKDNSGKRPYNRFPLFLWTVFDEEAELKR